MRKANCKTVNCSIYKRLAEMQLDEHDQQVVVCALHDAVAIADAVIWVKVRIASLVAMLPKPTSTGSPA